jgi:multidrug efflux pump subunit AcrB
MNFLTKFSLKNVVAVFLIVIMIVVGGVYSTGKVKQEAMPNISIPLITTTTLYIGATPEDVAERISRPLQKAVSGIQGVKSVKTISNENVSILVTEFGYSKDMDKAKKEIEDAIGRVTLPDNSERPITSKISMGGFPIMTYSIEGTMDINELSKFAKDKVKTKLSGIAGVSSIEIQGSQDQKIFIKLDSEKLSKNNLTIQDIQNTLAANNITIPAGQVTSKGMSMTVKLSNKVMSLNELKSIPFIVLPNQTKLISESMNKIVSGMTQLGTAVGELGSAVGDIGSAVGMLGQSVAKEGQGLQQVGQGVQQVGQLSASNTQAIALLNIVQKSQAYLLSQQAILNNPAATQEQKIKAGEAVKQSQAMLQGAQQGLDKLMNDLAKSSSSNSSNSSVGSKSTVGDSKSSNTDATTYGNVSSKGKVGTAAGAVAGNKISIKADKDQKITIKTVFLKDLARIYTGDDTQNLYTRADLKQGMILSVYKNDDANTVAIAKDIKNALEELSKANKNVKFNKIEDSSDTVKESVNGMVKEGLLGALFAVLVIAFFLRDIRATIIAVISIPLSILITLIILPMLDITINIVTLAGITVAIGRIVDDSIVVIENIYRRNRAGGGDGNEDMENLIESAAKEVSAAITSSTVTTVAVFVPLAFVSGLVGKFFVPFAITVVICMIASLLVATTVVPVMCKSMIKKGKPHKHQHPKNSKIVEVYIKILTAALKRKAIVILSSLVLMVIAFFMVSQVGVQFMPADTTSVLEAKLNLAPGTSVQETNKEAMKFEKYLMENKDVKTVVSTTGDNTGIGSGGGNGVVLNIQGSNSASFTIVLKDGIDYDAAAERITKKAKEFSKGDESIAIRTISSTGQRDNFNIIVKGDNMKDITAAAKMITNELKGEKDFTNLTNNLADKKKEILVEIDNNKAAKKGFTPLVVAGLVRGMMTNSSVMTIKDNGKDMDVQLGFKEEDINSAEKVKNIKISVLGISFKLSEVATVTENYGPVSISELDGNQYASISADVNGNDTQTIATNAMKKVDAMKERLPKTTTYELSGSSKDIQEGFSQMGFSMAVAVLLVYIVMMLAFGEATAPFAILFSLPFAVIGAIFALFFTGQSITLPTLVGMLMLIGIVVTNAIVLLDRVQKNRKKGMYITEALIEAGSIRLRPIFMTAIATVMALMPLALGFSKGTVLSQGLGIVVIGGLTLSTLLTLIIVPVIYASLEGIKERRKLAAN